MRMLRPGALLLALVAHGLLYRRCRDLARRIVANSRHGSDADELDAQREASKITRWIDKVTGMHVSSVYLLRQALGLDEPGTPVVCLPGLTRNSRDFEDLANHLRDRRRVITTDFRGRGFSDYDPEWEHYHPLTYVEDVITLLDHLGIEHRLSQRWGDDSGKALI